MADGLIFLVYLTGAFMTFGALLDKWGPLAVFLAIVWPATWVTMFGHWLASFVS